jgi:hypothetical protein
MAESNRSKVTLSPELMQCIQTMRVILAAHIRLIDGLIAVLIGHESAAAIRDEETDIDNQIVLALAPMLQALGSSCNTLVLLSDVPGLQTRDCYSIVRSIVEACINICYIIAEGPPAADRALRHARQKAFRDLERQSQIGESVVRLIYSATPDAKTIKGLEADLEEFTSRQGREKGWTDLSVDERIAVVGKRLGSSMLNSLHFARFMIYRHSSEVLHGTLFGVLHFWGETSPSASKKSMERFAKTIGKQHMLILFAAIIGVSAVIDAFHRVYGFAAAHEKSRELFNKLGEIPYLHDRTT